MKNRYFILPLLLITTVLLSAVSASAADKTEFTQNEDILVTAVGEGNDWVGLYLRGATPGQSAAIYWYYIAQDAEPGEAVDIRETRTNGQTEYEEVPPGEYTMWFLLDDGYEPFDSVDFTVKATLELDKFSYKEGDDILVTANGSGKDWVGLYRQGEIPGSGISSIYWYYVAEDGNTPLEPVNILDGNFNSDRADAADLPAGDYTMYLCANDGYDVIDSIDFKIAAGPKKTEEPAPEPEPEPAEEPAPEPAEEPTGNPEPEQVPAEADPEAPAEPAVTEPDEAKNSGCGSFVCGGLIVLIAILGSALAAKRR